MLGLAAISRRSKKARLDAQKAFKARYLNESQ